MGAVAARLALLATLAALIVGCGSSPASSRAEQCAGLMLGPWNAEHRTVSEAISRTYVLRTYCRPFAARGWVYNDGALSIEAQKWLAHGARCATGTEGGGIHNVPCRVVEDGVLDCSMLHFVRRSEVRTYIAALQKDGPVACDDATPPDALGVP